MGKTIILIIVLTVVAAVVDYLWLGVLAKSFYTNALGSIMRPAGAQADMRVLAAAGVYLLLALSVVLFVLPKGGEGIITLILWGALVGFILYAVYNLTNYAVLTHWPFSVVLADTLWGTVFLAILSLAGHHIQRLIS